MIDFTKPLRTVGGKHPVNIFTTKANLANSPIVGEYLNNWDWRICASWGEDGIHRYNSAFNLENIPQRLTGEVYLTLYRGPDGDVRVGGGYATLESARDNAKFCRRKAIARVTFDVEEGENLK